MSQFRLLVSTTLIVGSTTLLASNEQAWANSDDSGSFASQPIGFGADTDEFIITRDLSVYKEISPRSYDTSKGALFETTLAFFTPSLENVAPSPLLTDEVAARARAIDDSYMLRMMPSQHLETIHLCATETLTSVFSELSKTRVECGITPMESAENLTVKSGAMLLIADRDIEVELKIGKLKVAEGAIVLICNGDCGSSIFNFHDGGRKSVTITVGDQTIPIVPGKHINATKAEAKEFAAVNDLDRIAHRHINKSATEDGIILWTSEFSTLSAIEAIEPMKKVLTSDHPEARKLAQKMIKTSAVLMHLGAGSEQFKHHLKPRMASIVDSRL